MPFLSPAQITEAGTVAGVTKSHLSADKLVVSGFLAGAYIAFGGLLAIVASAGMSPDNGLITVVTGVVFSLGLILVVVAGGELLTGNMALVPLAALRHRVGGALFVAYFLAYKTGVVDAPITMARMAKIAIGKAVTETDSQVFFRAVGCNWLVCLAVWMAVGAQDIGGKILAIVFPITAFVALGFDHVVANFFFLPLAKFAHVPGIGWGDVVGNWGLAFAGNLVGAGIFVAGFYWYLYGRPEDTEGATPPAGSQVPGP